MSMQRVEYLDGLRGLAAMQVVLNHYTLAFAPGWVGPLGFFADGVAAVLLFFLMSGLVLTYSFERTPNAIAGGMANRPPTGPWPAGDAKSGTSAHQLRSPLPVGLVDAGLPPSMTLLIAIHCVRSHP
jgi:hypothetical protein